MTEPGHAICTAPHVTESIVSVTALSHSQPKTTRDREVQASSLHQKYWLCQPQERNQETNGEV